MGHPALFGRSINSLEIQLVFIGAKVEHQLKNLFLDLVRAAVGLVYLVDYHDGLLAHVDGLVEHEPCLGHTAFKCVYKQQDAIGHIEHALNLSAKVTVAGSIYDVDFYALVGDGYILCQNGDAALPLKVIVVQDKISKVLRPSYQIGLINHPVHEGCFTVVYVCDNGYVSDVLHKRSLINLANLLKISLLPI